MVKRLYHGGKVQDLSSVLKSGLVPRGSRSGNWTKYPGRQDMVYLTTTYPFYFAINCSSENPISKVVVYEIDATRLDDARYYPDEDFVAQVVSKVESKGLRQVHFKIRDGIEKYRRYWRDSVNGLGNLAYRGTIQPGAITRYCVLDCQQRGDLASCLMDPTITLFNARICGQRYRQAIKWCFGDTKGLPFTSEASENARTVPEPYKEPFKRAAAFWRKEERSRKGLEVVSFHQKRKAA